jgi:hypothetical protein
LGDVVTEQSGGPAEAIKKITDQVEISSDPSERPQQFVREMHKQWRKSGGRVGGKPRHSDRYLDDRLKEAGMPVRSLTSKLIGRTRMRGGDVSTLVQFFLSQWPTVSEADDEQITYGPLLPAADIKTVSDYIETQIEEHVKSAEFVPADPQDAEVQEPLPGESSAEVILRHFQECDAHITASPVQILVSAGPGKEFVGFRDLMDQMRAVEERDRKRRPLIWILDMGGLKLDDLSTRKKYHNVQTFISRFKALKRFEDVNSDDRWNWLLSRAVIIVLDTYYGRDETLHHSKRPDFAFHHLSLSNINPDWAISSNFRALYGSNFERIEQRVFTISYNAAGVWPSSPSVSANLRYFGYGTFTREKGKEEYGRGLELPQLPARYNDAMRTACIAAAHVLKLDLPTISKKSDGDPSTVSGEIAIRKLEYLGYRVLLLDEFLEEC